MMKKIIIVIVALIIIGGLGYFVFLNKEDSTPQDPRILIGWWQNTNKGPDANYKDLQYTDYLEFKEKEICLGYEQDSLGELSCSKYSPYRVEGNTISVDNNPHYTWRFRGDTLEIQQVFGQMRKETYKKMQ